MTRIKRPAVAVGVTALLAFSLTACGGSPTDASEKDFCGAFEDAFAPLLDISADGEPTEDQWEEFQDAVGELEDVGTTEDISDDEREGFEVFVKAVGDADYDDVKDAEDDEFPGVDKDDQDKVEDFFTYATKTCPEAFGAPAE